MACRAVLYAAWCLVVFTVCLACSLAWSLILARRMSHTIKFDYPNRTEMEELQAPMADSAFYLSYYYDVVRSPSLVEGLSRLIWDDRSEAPDTVNALHKFNVVPELLVACLHRILGLSMSPYAFYVWCVVAVTGLGVFSLTLSAVLVGDCMLCGLAASSMYFSLCYSPTMQAGTRIMGGTFALREFWGVPAMLMQNAWLVIALRPSAGRSCLLGFTACTCLFEMAWQFAPFVLLLQTLSLLGAHTLGSLPRQKLGEVGLAAVAGTLAALLLSFGNRMLLCSPFFALASCVAFIGLAPLPTRWAGRSGGLFEAAWVLVAALTGGAATQQVLARAASGQEDKHVLQLLLQKLGFAPADASFDAFLYLQSPEFGFLDKKYVEEGIHVLALPAAGLSAVLLAVAFLRRRLVPHLCGCCHRGAAPEATKPTKKAGGAPANKQRKGEVGRPAQKSDKSEADVSLDPAWAAWVVETLFLVALILLAALVNRLRVLTAPLLCLVGSLAASPKLWGEAVWRRWPASLFAYTLGLLLMILPLHRSGAVERIRQVGEMQADPDMYELVRWANQSLPAGSLFMADMTMAAKFRMISPNVRVGNHPQYESLTSRQRNRAYYRTFTCAPPERVHEVLSQYGVTHVLLNANACRARIGKLDAFHEKPDQCGEVPAARLRQKTFCWAGWLSEEPGRFELAFRNPVYTVLRVQNVSAPTKRAAAKDIARASTWRAWLAGLKDVSAAQGLAHAAARWPQAFGGFEVAEAMQRRAEELAPEDPLVILQRGQLQQQNADDKGAANSMAKAAKLASKAAALDELHKVYTLWKDELLREGEGSRDRVRRLAKLLKGHMEASHNAFDLCDLGGWLKDLGDRSLGKSLWDAAKRVNLYDQCVREDWMKWEGKELQERDLWRAFLQF